MYHFVYFMNVPKYLLWHLGNCAPSHSIIYCNRENTAFLLRNWSNFAFVFAWCSTSLCNNSIYDAIYDGGKTLHKFCVGTLFLSNGQYHSLWPFHTENFRRCSKNALTIHLNWDIHKRSVSVDWSLDTNWIISNHL